jgi:CDP-diacylglycerol--serine O-phosphatidyltransferase
LALAAWSYVFLGLILAIIRMIAGKKSKTLEEFEPDPEEEEQ